MVVTAGILFLSLAMSLDLVFSVVVAPDGSDCAVNTELHAISQIMVTIDMVLMALFIIVLFASAIFTIYILRKQAKALRELTGELLTPESAAWTE